MPIPITNQSARSGGDTERLACSYLQAGGLHLLERNYRCRRGGIDLVMREGDTLVFVEVRFRASSRFGTPAETVNIHKQRRLTAAAARYLRHHPTKPACRFNVIVVSGNHHVDWIRNAFNVQ